MSFRLEKCQKRQLRTWHGRAGGGTIHANNSGKTSKRGGIVTHGRAPGGTARAKLSD